MKYEIKQNNLTSFCLIPAADNLSPFDVDINGTIYCYFIGDATNNHIQIKDFIAIICPFNQFLKEKTEIVHFSEFYPIIHTNILHKSNDDKIVFVQQNIDDFIAKVKEKHNIELYSTFIEYMKMHKIQTNNNIIIDTILLDDYLYNIKMLKSYHKHQKQQKGK